ncbi:cobalt-precorrin-5B (C(1))-methyltransferase, partial [Micromonospora sp. DH15]|nr:cobalt-precorrin-5B (C(1))-methyltransferase [Micromonospora sp. DH15]
LAGCELAYFWRHESRAVTAALGRPVREALGGVATVAVVLALAAGCVPGAPGQAEAAGLLRPAGDLLCARVRQVLLRFAGHAVDVDVAMVDFAGERLVASSGRWAP